MTPKPPRLTVTMAAALDLVAKGSAPKDAASQAGVNLNALYTAIRRTAQRCPNCGQRLPTHTHTGE